MTTNTNTPHPTPNGTGSGREPFIDPRDLPKAKLADGTVIKTSHKIVRMKKSRLGRRYNGKHRD